MDTGVVTLTPAVHAWRVIGEVGPLLPIVPRPPVEKVTPGGRHPQRERRNEQNTEDSRRSPKDEDDTSQHIDEYAQS